MDASGVNGAESEAVAAEYSKKVHTGDASEGRLDMVPFPPPVSQQVKRIVFTGGPYGGKTEALSRVAERLRSMGLQVFIVPDIANLMTNAGAGLKQFTDEHRIAWVEHKLRMQMTTESALIRVAEASNRASIVLLDGGCLDSAALCNAEEWKVALGRIPAGERELLDRYDAVVHLETIALAVDLENEWPKAGDFPEFDPSLFCTKGKAIELDKRLCEVWRAHPRFTTVKNPPGGLEVKIQHAVSEICHFLGVMSPGLFKLQFLIDPSVLDQELRMEWVQGFIDTFDVEITFLAGSNSTSNDFVVRRVGRTFCEADSFARCTKRVTPATPKINPDPVVLPCALHLGPAELGPPSNPVPLPPHSPPGRHMNNALKLVSTESLITRKEYNDLIVSQTMNEGKTLHITRRCFCYKHQWFKLDDYKEVHIVILEVEVPTKTTEPQFPKWLQPHIKKKVTGTPDEVQYQPYKLAGGTDGQSPTLSLSGSVSTG
ncbi:TRPL translocation defect protein 14 [Diplonema papillatum]|nr:TRPL translocation defect protein 14 [Diplonema papillatum]|eukprot:gene15533-23704_t